MTVGQDNPPAELPPLAASLLRCRLTDTGLSVRGTVAFTGQRRRVREWARQSSIDGVAAALT